MDDKIDHRQYARNGYSTTDALLCTGCKLSMKRWIVVRLLLDCSSLISQRDFILLTKPLMQELDKLEIHPVLLKWIAAFLTNR